MKKIIFHVDSAVYQQLESLRKSYVGEPMTKDEAIEFLVAAGIPADTKKVWELALEFNLLFKKGATRYTRYLVPKDMYSQHTLDKMLQKYYGGKIPKEEKEESLDKERGRIKLSPKFCRDYLDQCDDPLLVDFCIEQLKKRGNFIIFEVTPKIHQLKAISLEYLFQNSEAEMK